MIATEKIRAVKEQIDILKIFERYNIPLIKKGVNYLANCPFHKDESPSLSVNPTKNLWQCFGCGAAGDTISLIQKLENFSFPDSVNKLSDLQNSHAITLNKTPLKEKRYRSLIKSGTTVVENQELMNIICQFYHQALNTHSEAKQYLQNRHIFNTYIYKVYKIGFADGSLVTQLTQELGNDIKTQLINLGVLLENGKERFHNCIVFPILDDTGNCISFYGRHIQIKDGGHFYLPGPKKGIFNHKQLKEKNNRSIIITESIIDTLSFIYNDIFNVLPIYGTNGLTDEIISFLTGLIPAQIIIALDGDEQGQKAALHLKEKLSHILPQTNYQIVTFPNQLDTNEYFKTHSKVQFEALMDPRNKSEDDKLKGSEDNKLGGSENDRLKEHPILKHCHIKFAEAKNGKLTVTIKAENPKTKRFLLDIFNLYANRQRQALTKNLADLFGLKISELETVVDQLISIAEQQVNDGNNYASELESNDIQMTAQEEKIAVDFLKKPDIFSQIISDYDDLGYIGEAINKKIAYLVMTSRKMKNPLSLVIMSNSAAGKSSLQKATLEFCPSSEAKHFTRLTQQSLYYLGEESLKHKFLSIEEAEGSSEASYSLKALLSAKQLNVIATDTDQQTGRKKATEYKTEGPIAVMISSTSPELEAEFASRTMIISIDETSAQTKSIHQSQKHKRTFLGQQKNNKKDQIINRDC